MKDFFHTLFFPPALPLAALIAVSVILQIVVFGFGYEDTPLAYATYLIAAYTLAAVCARLGAFLFRRWKALTARNPVLARWQTDLRFKAEVSIWSSFGVNVLYAVYKAILGIYYRSGWFGSVAAYYLLLSVIRFLLLRHILKRRDDAAADWQRYRLSGGLLLVLTAILSMMAWYTLRDNAGGTYPGHLILITAGYTLFNLYLALRNVAKYRKLGSPVISASKCISLSTALVSIFTLQTAMFLAYGTASEWERSMNIAVAAVVFTLVFILSLFMIVRGTEKLRQAR